MSEKENEEKAFRKKQRSVLNTIREACIYQNPVMISDGDFTNRFIPVELKENAFRDLEETRVFVTKGGGVDHSKQYSVKIEEKGELISVPLKLLDTSSEGSLIWEFPIQKMIFENRRRRSRKTSNESYFVPILIYLQNSKLFPVPGFARVVDYDHQAISFEVRAEVALEAAEMSNAKFSFQKDLLPTTDTCLHPSIIRNFSVIKHFDGYQTSALIVSRVEFLNKHESNISSLIQPRGESKLEFRLFFKDATTIDVAIKKVLLDGFEGDISSLQRKTLPQYFLSEHISSHIRFNVINHDDGVFFKIASTDFGTRTQWYNYLTKAVLKYQYRFQPNDAKDITRLMLESGNYSNKAISELVLQHNYLQHKWPLEESIPKTKYRWLVKDDEGSAIGHTAGVRVSEKLWAAIDNIGSQTYSGSWNSEYVSRWIRAYVELLDGHPSDPLVQWTYNPRAGVWNQFDKDLEASPDLLFCKDRIWSCFFSNTTYSQSVERSMYSIEPLSHPESSDASWVEEFKFTDKKFFNTIYKGTHQASSFLSDFESDYSQKFSRFFFLVKKDAIPFCVVSFSNYPVWASLNKTHDWAYVFPLNESQGAFENENEFTSLIREKIYEMGCTPFRLGIVSSGARLSFGNEWTNLILKPLALELAARTLDKL